MGKRQNLIGYRRDGIAENTFDRFSVFFTGDTVFLDGTVFPLGQLTTDVLNLDSEVLTEIDQRVNAFISAVWTLLQEKTGSAACSAQERLNAVWDLVFELPVYRSLHLDMETARNLFPTVLSDREKWAETLDIDSEGHRMFEDFLSGLEYFAESLRNFRGQLDGILEMYFEPLSRRSADEYAGAYAAYFNETAAAGGLFFPELEFEQSFPHSFVLSLWHTHWRQEKFSWQKRWSSVNFPTFFILSFTEG